jgi:hypothetical protein
MVAVPGLAMAAVLRSAARGKLVLEAIHFTVDATFS